MKKITNDWEMLKELFLMIKHNKKWWLLPLLFVLALLSVFASISGTQSILPVIYALF